MQVDAPVFEDRPKRNDVVVGAMRLDRRTCGRRDVRKVRVWKPGNEVGKESGTYHMSLGRSLTEGREMPRGVRYDVRTRAWCKGEC